MSDESEYSESEIEKSIAKALAVPGRGWSNGDIRPEMFAHTRAGKVQLYSSQRRWIHLAHGWSRIGESENGKRASQYSRRVSFSHKGTKIVESRGG